MLTSYWPRSTRAQPLLGGEGYTKNTGVKLIQKYGIDERTAKHLAKAYGTRAFDVCELSRPVPRAVFTCLPRG